MIKNNIILLFIFINLNLVSQELYKGTINNDVLKGFKSVELTPNIRSIANRDFSDVRIFNVEKQQIPYYLEDSKSRYDISKSFLALKNDIQFKKKRTVIIIPNETKQLFRNFVFQVSNADVHKTCKIEGSHHKKQWFTISEKIHLSLNNDNTKAFNYYSIHFPSIDYEYIKIVINDSISAPIQINQIGYFKRIVNRKEDTFVKLKHQETYSQKNNESLIHITTKRPFEVNKISFDIAGSEFYNREVHFYTFYKDKKKQYKKVFLNLTLNSENKLVFNKSFTQKDFWISIDNKDNQPFTKNKVVFYQKRKFLVADLKPNKKYIITAGDKTLKKPSYDLINFKNKIDKNLPIVKIQNETLYSKSINTQIQKQFYEENWFMWVSIGLVGLILLFFTISLMNQAKKEA